MRLGLAPFLFSLAACGLVPSAGDLDNEGRSGRIQNAAFGRVVIGENQFMIYHVTPDEGTQRWLYWITPQQHAQLSRQCRRNATVTVPPDVYQLGPGNRAPGCVIWERRDATSSLTIAISATTFEIFDEGKAEDRLPR